MKKTALLLLLFIVGTSSAQEVFTRKDSLQGGLRFERTSYDVLRYDLNITFDTERNFISGFNDITFKIVEPTAKIQLDLFENMAVDSIVLNGKKLQYKREFNAVFIDFPTVLAQDTKNTLRFYYSGSPKIARQAPWDGGIVLSRDFNGKPWIGMAVQGSGASLWFPCKDSQSDEPDWGATIKVAVPNGLMNVSNGRFIGNQDLKNGYTRWDWEVKSPINNYDITINIADYAHLHDNHNGLDLDYYVIRGNEQVATKQFAEVKPMMDCFQSKFGRYPFARDGYKLVETPYLGMEHQSAVAYGNRFMKGYMGRDLSKTGIGMLFDYILIHESAHEWFGNSITSKDIADMWIHEAYTMYAESVYLECVFGYDQAMRYVNGLRSNFDNDRPIIGQYGVNNEGSGDMYYKGALMLNTLRHIVNDDPKWWAILLKYSETYRHKIIDTPTVISFFNAETGIDLTPVFDQYLRTTAIPKLVIKRKKNKIGYRWQNVGNRFAMPVDIRIGQVQKRLYPTTILKWTNVGAFALDSVSPLTDHFLIDVEK